MAWVKLDDSFCEHPKIQRVGPAGLALFVRGLSYCNRNLTDGFIPDRQAQLDEVWSKGSIMEMIVAGLFVRVAGGYQIHDYLSYQPSKAQVLAEREGTKRRVSEWRKRNAVTNGVSTPAPVPVPVPVPIPDPEKKDTVPAARSRFVAPDLQEVTAYCRERKNRVDPDAFLAYYESNGWRVGRNPMRSWKAAVRTWEKHAFSTNGNGNGHVTLPVTSGPDRSALEKIRKDREQWEKENAQ